MAELFLKQGHSARAVWTYRKYVEHHPEDAQAAARLAAIEEQLGLRPGGVMSFREHLQRIVDSTPGALASTLMGFDGIAIDTYQVGNPDLDVATLLIEYSAATQQVRKGADLVPQAGSVVTVEIAAEHLIAMMRPVTDEVFLGVILEPSAVTGKARYLMRLAGPQLAKELL